MTSAYFPPNSPYFLSAPPASPAPVMEMQKAVLWQTDTKGARRNFSPESNASFSGDSFKSSQEKNYSLVSGPASSAFSEGIQGLASASLPFQKQYPCDHIGCNKSYTRKYNLISHQLSAHSHIRPYSCPVSGCSASFSRPHDLRRHTRSIHSAYRPYKCSNCDMTFARSDALKRHTDRDEGRRSKGGKGCEDLREFKRVVEANTIIEYRPDSIQRIPMNRSVIYSQLPQDHSQSFDQRSVPWEYRTQNSQETKNEVKILPQGSQLGHSTSIYPTHENMANHGSNNSTNETSYRRLHIPTEKYLPISPISEKSYYEVYPRPQHRNTPVPVFNKELTLPPLRSLKIMDLLN
ncbi:hypothetical protein HK096_007521 [Nowakowskiella sp. JEL0078]|nr:hypothetical protein HK096_007521 [Nowakowskiella sp. JEL0078]